MFSFLRPENIYDIYWTKLDQFFKELKPVLTIRINELEPRRRLNSVQLVFGDFQRGCGKGW